MDLNDLERMGRRRFMETLAGIGVSSTTLNYLEQDELRDLTYDPEEEVPYVDKVEIIDKKPGQPPQREPTYDTVEREKWKRRKAAIGVRDDLNEWINNELQEPDITTAFRRSDHSPTDFGVRVYNTANSEFSTEELEDLLPTEATGLIQGEKYEDIPISLHESDPRPLCDYKSRDSNTVPGGDKLISDVGGSTCMGTFHSDQYGDGIVGAGHAFEEEMRVSKIKPDVNSYMGHAKEVVNAGEDKVKQKDCAFIKLDREDIEYSPMDAITSSDNSYIEFTIEGHYTNESLEAHAGEGDTLEAIYQGKSTCRGQGHVVELYPGNEAVGFEMETDKQIKDGDSGGPCFDGKGTEAYMIGAINGVDGKLGNDLGTATTAQTIEDELGGYIY